MKPGHARANILPTELEEEVEDEVSSPLRNSDAQESNPQKGSKELRSNHHRTNRKVLLKLELTGDVAQQLETVNRTIFDSDARNNIKFLRPASDSSNWPVVDEVLYSVPKQTYDSIYKAFMSEPRVYKLESVKERVWKIAKEEIGDDVEAMLTTSWEIPSKKRRKKRRGNQVDEGNISEDATSSYIDPFTNGEVEPIWKEKLQILEKLSPREDLNGYEYKEDYFEQQYRFALQADFQAKMKREIQRRTKHPTFIEQVEDVLFDMVERVASAFDAEMESKKLARREYLRSLRHPATREAKMKPLLRTEAENGQLIQVITDLEFEHMIITDGHYVISPTIPNKVLYQHEQERRLLAEIRRKEVEERDLIRRMPLTEKIRSAVALAKTDLKTATRQIMHDFMDKTVLLPTEPIRDRFKQILSNGLKGLVDMGKDPEKTASKLVESILDAYDVIIEGQKVIHKKKTKKNAEDFLEEANKIQDPQLETTDQQIEINLDKSVKNAIPDSILVKFMMDFDPPPLYIMRPRRSMRAKVRNLFKQAHRAIRKGHLSMAEKIKLLLPKRHGADSISYIAALRKLAQLDSDDEFDDEEEINVQNLLSSPVFDGFLHRSDLIIYPKEGDPEADLPLEFDDHRRKMFEQTFLNELAFSAGIPKENFSIEEIRRFSPNHPHLMQAISNKEATMESAKILIMEKELIMAIERLKRKALSNGIVLSEEDIGGIASYQRMLPWNRRQLFAETKGRVKYHAARDAELINISDAQCSSMLANNDRSNHENSFLLVKPIPDGNSFPFSITGVPHKLEQTSHILLTEPNVDFVTKVVRSLLNEIITHIEEQNQFFGTANDDPFDEVGVFPNIEHNSMEPNTALHSSVILSDHSDVLIGGAKFDDEVSQQIVKTGDLNGFSSSSIGKSLPYYPTTSELGISNPDDRKYDKLYWLSKHLRTFSPQEKQNHRIGKLPLLRDYYRKEQEGYYAAKYRNIKEDIIFSAEEFEEDMLDWITPLLDKVEPFLDKAKKSTLLQASGSSLHHANLLIKQFISIILKIPHKMLNISDSDRTRLKRLGNTVDTSRQEKVQLTGFAAMVDSVDEDIFIIRQLLHEMVDRVAATSSPISKANDATVMIIADRDSNPPQTLINRREYCDTSQSIMENENSSLGEGNYPSFQDSQHQTDVTVVNDVQTSNDNEIAKNITGESVDENDLKEQEEDAENSQDEDGSNPDEHAEEDLKSEGDDEEEDEEESEGEDDDIEDKEEEFEDEEQEREDEKIQLKVIPSEDDSKSGRSKEESTEVHPNAEIDENQTESSDHNHFQNFDAHEVDDGDNNEANPRGKRNILCDMSSRHHYLRGSLESGTKWSQYDSQFWNRVQEIDFYPFEVTESLQEICDYIDEMYTPKHKLGCEVSVLINVKDDQRRIIPGLQSLCSEDIAIYLQRQHCDPDSVLNQCKLTRRVVDVKIVPIFRTTPYFETWNSFWVHILHPSFFTYSAKNAKSSKLESNRCNGDPLEALSGNLPSGLKMINPVQTFDERTREAYTTISNKPILPKPGERIKRVDESMTEEDLLEEQSKLNEESIGQEKENVVDMDADEYAKEFRSNGVKIYRPKMSDLTKKDVQRLQRVYRALKDQYDSEMLKGLVNNGLRPSQFNALKDLNSAHRIYRSAKQRFERLSRHKSASNGEELDEVDNEDFTLPVLQVTRIGQDLFDSWLEEVREEDRIRLKLKREKAEKMKRALQQEAFLRRQIEKTKVWIMENFMKFYDAHRPKIDRRKTKSIPNGTEDDKHVETVGELIDRTVYPSITGLYKSYFCYSHDLLELEHQLRLEIEKKEEESRLLLEAKTVNLPPESDDIDGSHSEHLLTDKEKNVVQLLAQKLEKKKVTISEEKKARKLFALALKWDEQGGLTGVSAIALKNRLDGANVDLERNASVSYLSNNNATGSLVDTADDQIWRFGVADALVVVDDILKSLEYPNIPNNKQAVLEAAEGASKVEVRKNSLLELVDFIVGALELQQRIETDPIPDDDDEEEIVKRNALIVDFAERTKYFTADEWELGRDILWIRAMVSHPPFFNCLQHFPTIKSDMILRDEIVQFASILVELSPIFSNIIKELDMQKLQNEISLGIKPSKEDKHALAKKRREDRRRARETAKELTADEKRKLERDRLEEIRRTAEREKAWFMAHPHKFVRKKFDENGKPLHPSEKITFCLVCKEKAFDYWLKSHNDGEKGWSNKIHDSIGQRLESMDIAIGTEVESVVGSQLQLQAKEEVHQALIEEGLIKTEKKRWFGLGKTSNDSAVSVSSSGDVSSDDFNSVDQERRKWEEEMKKMKAIFTKKGFALLDAHGKRIFSKEPPKKKVSESGPLVTPVVVIDDALLNVVPHTISPHHHPEPIGDIHEQNGLKIRVFHRSDDGERLRFLGMIEFSAKDIKKPPKGFRTLRLKDDPHIIDPQGVTITGSITIQFNRTSTHKGDQIRNHYKLQIKKLTDIFAMDDEKLSNPYCEVYWKGEVEKPIEESYISLLETTDDSNVDEKKLRKTKKLKTEILLMKDYSTIGVTKTKSRCIEVEYNKDEEDNSYFELPPIYTRYPIPCRGPRESDVAKNGGYVAKNQIPDPPIEDVQADVDQRKISLNPAQASLEEIIEYREHVKYKELLAVEKNLYTETYRYVMIAEEKERCYMAREEAAQRIVEWSRERDRYAQDLRVQEIYARSFQRLLELMVSPSPILSRLRFLMGEENDGDELNFNHSTILFNLANNGENKFKANPILPGMHSTLSKKHKPMNNTMKLRCEDPATSQIFSLVCTPMASKQDEGDMEANALKLVGKYAPNLIKIIDFAIHQLRTYNAQGFTAIYERVAVVVMEYANGITLHQYMVKNWNQLDNDSFRELLLQIAQGLDDLHQEGVIHRNLCPQEVLVQLQEASLARASYKTQTNDKGSKNQEFFWSKPILRIGGYWFIENPRTVDCTSSLGRSDWGNRITAPPESLGFEYNDGIKRTVSEKSDIYAFGVCVFFWATMGYHLPPEFKTTHNVETLRPLLPRKWGQWVFSLLRMCLSIFPHRRASAKELVMFLQNRMGKT